MITPEMTKPRSPKPKAAANSRASAAARQRLSLADALFSGTQQRVLALLFGQPDRSFYASELIALAQAGSGAVQRELARLAQSELVTVQLSGNQKHYRANPASPIFDELCGIVRKTTGLAQPLREALAPLLDRIKAAFVYGSVAKRQDAAGSDIDLMIVSDDVTYADLYQALETASRQLGRAVNPTIYTSAELAKRSASGGAFVTRVLGQPKIWLKGDERALAV
jgi:predicted nucleotidyltransferase